MSGSGSSPHARLSVATLCALALALGGCSDGGTHAINNSCPKLADAVGGNPAGTWGVTTSCQVPYARTASSDLCSQLVYDSSGVQDGLFLGQELTPILALSTVTFDDDPPGPSCGPKGTCGAYSAQLIFGGTATTNFPRGCLTQHEANPTCDDLQIKMESLIDLNVLPTVKQGSLTCLDAANGDGCDCSYEISTAGIAPDQGAWRLDGDHLVTYPGTGLQAGVVDFAVELGAADGNDHLHMHGHDGMPLLAHDPVRNLDLIRCTDANIKLGLFCPCTDDAAKRGVCTQQQ